MEEKEGRPGRGEARAPSRRDMSDVFHRSEGMVSALLDSASQAIISVDRSGHIALANSRAEEMFGYTSQELVDSPIELLLPESKRDGHVQQRQEYGEHPRVRHMGIGLELSGRRKDGVEFPVEVSLSYIQIPEGFFAIAFVSDITQRKNLEGQLMHAQKMEAVGRLAGGVAHDFNNMLTVIAGYSRMLLDELAPVDPLREYAEEVLKASEKASALTGQLLAFSRRQIMQPRILNVNQVLVNAEKMLRRLIGEDINLALTLGPGVGNIKADPGHVEQAIMNLAVNARDAMPLGGHLTIETCNVRLDEDYARSHMGVVPGEFVMIAVTDSGTGMDATTRARIFEPFFTTKEKGKGTGLGLATVYGIVKQTGGDIWVYSEVGKGSTFKLYFPRVDEVPHETEATVEEPKGRKETILVVEDEKAVRDLTVKMLRRLGYEILTASTGKEAIQIVQAHAGAINLLLTDVVMPNMSGRQLANAITNVRPDIKVLFLSGYTEEAIVNHGVLEGGVDFLPKPFTRDVLGKKLREVLSKEPPLSTK